MLLRRLYSSLPQRAASAPAAAAAPKPHTRGRARPVRVKTAIRVKTSSSVDVLASTSASVSAPTHGRRLHRSVLVRRDETESSSSSSFHAELELVSSELPRPTAPGWTPVSLYPAQAALHLGFTPSHMPLPVHLGTMGYVSTDASIPALWERPAALSAAGALPAADANASSLGEHLRVTQAFAHPALAHHLGPQPQTSMRAIDVDADSRLTSLLDAARTKHTDAASSIWEASLQRMGATAVAEPTRTAVEQASIDDAIAGLEGLLARLGPSVEDEVVEMDSVRRKRKKKMNKHKYKKRRKATQAERRRLGK